MLLRILAALLGLVLLGAVVLAWMFNHHPSMAPHAALAWARPAPPAPPPLRVSFLGVATVLLDDGQTAILTDGFFSRPGKLQALFGKVEPDVAAIERGLARAGIPQRTGRLAAVIPLHSHYDHAMDAPEVARRTGALLIGSASTLNIGRGWGLADTQMQAAVLNQPMRFGAFTLTLRAGRHAPTGFTGGQITAPLKPPVRAFAYREGQSYVLQVEHGGRSLIITGSAGYEPGALAGVRAEVAYLGIGALGLRDTDYMAAYWNEVVAAVGARRVLPIHWDDFMQPTDEPVRPMPLLLDRFDSSIGFLRERAAGTGVQVVLPPLGTPIDPWAGLAPR